MTTLTDQPTSLAFHEHVIEQGLDNFLAVGASLLYIRDNLLYKEGYDSFAAYVAKRWQHKFTTRQQAYRLMNAFTVNAELSPIGVVPNENVARELGAIKDDSLRNTVWQAAVGTFGSANVTATIVKATKTVIETLETTKGYVDIADGVMTPLGAAITAEATEIANRQRQHIVDNSTPPLYKEKLRISQLTSVVNELVKHYGDREVRVIIYEVRPP